MKKSIYLLVLAVLMIAACEPKTMTVDLKAEADSIRTYENQWVRAIINKDVDKIMSFYSTEAIQMDPDLPSLEGLDNIKKAWEIFADDTTMILDTYKETIDSIEVSATGDIAYSRGKFISQIKTGNQTVEMEGKWLTLWKKFDGKWKVIVSINNSSKPR